jgi:4-aminobutyrate aminotransferase-like enzyme
MIAMAAVLATIEAIEQDNMISNAVAVEGHSRQRLSGISTIRAVRGKGCLLGIEFSDKCSEIHARLLERKIITGTSSDANVLRLLPPLCVSIEQIDLFVDQLIEISARSARQTD